MARAARSCRGEPQAAPIGRVDRTIRRLTRCMCFRKPRSRFWAWFRRLMQSCRTWITSKGPPVLYLEARGRWALHPLPRRGDAERRQGLEEEARVAALV